MLRYGIDKHASQLFGATGMCDARSGQRARFQGCVFG